MLLDKIVSTLVQLTVVLVLYVPVIIGYRLWARRRANRILGGPIKPGTCVCGKWEMPVGVGVEINLAVHGPAPFPPTAVTLRCPKCSIPHLMPIVSTMLKSHAMAQPLTPPTLSTKSIPAIPLRRV